MSNLKEAFAFGRALIPFITCGDPSLMVTAEIIKKAEESGASAAVLAIPFSDPTAEGAALQAASLRALSGGVTTDTIMDMLGAVRRTVKMPLVCMTYANVVFSYGIEAFLKRAQAAGIDGLMLRDVPVDEREEFAPLCRKYGIDFILAAAPGKTERLEKICAAAEGFLLLPGAAENEIGTLAAEAKKKTEVPLVVTYSGTELVLPKAGDGVMVDTTVVEAVGVYGEDAPEKIAGMIREMKKSLS